MKMETVLWLEWLKLRRRGIPLLFAAVFLLTALWMGWSFGKSDASGINDQRIMIYLNLLLISTILVPITLAALACRLCDMEQMGNTYKWICTIEEPEAVYRGKVLTGILNLTVLSLLECGIYEVLAVPAGGASLLRGFQLFFTLFLAGTAIFILQLNLSLWFSNQLTPVLISIGGTFAGLFSWFLPDFPLRYVIPWGYYGVLCNAGYIYDEANRYTTCYWTGYRVIWAVFLALAAVLIYLRGQKRFLSAVREMI